MIINKEIGGVRTAEQHYSLYNNNNNNKGVVIVGRVGVEKGGGIGKGRVPRE